MKPLVTCALLFIALLGAARCAGTPPGHEERALAGSDRCADCHEEEARFWRYGAHQTVACEECHGPGAEHAGAGPASRLAMSLGDTELCLACHGQGAARATGVVSTIGSFEQHLRQLELDHRVKLDPEKSGTGCVYCHDPHLLE